MQLSLRTFAAGFIFSKKLLQSAFLARVGGRNTAYVGRFRQLERTGPHSTLLLVNSCEHTSDEQERDPKRVFFFRLFGNRYVRQKQNKAKQEQYGSTKKKQKNNQKSASDGKLIHTCCGGGKFQICINEDGQIGHDLDNLDPSLPL